MAESTHVRLKEGTADTLHDRKERGETYDDVVSELIQIAQIAESQGITVEKAARAESDA